MYWHCASRRSIQMGHKLEDVLDRQTHSPWQCGRAVINEYGIRNMSFFMSQVSLIAHNVTSRRVAQHLIQLQLHT